LQKSPVKEVSFAREPYKRDDIHDSREKNTAEKDLVTAE